MAGLGIISSSPEGKKSAESFLMFSRIREEEEGNRRDSSAVASRVWVR